MNISKLQRIVPLVVVACALGLTAAPALAKKDAKTKNSEKTTAKENSGRQTGELPSGLQKYAEKKGQLPSGLQAKKDENAELSKGLTTGGKKLAGSPKGNKPSK